MKVHTVPHINAPKSLKCDMCDFEAKPITVLWKHMMRDHKNKDKNTAQIAEDDVVMSGLVQ